MTFFLFEQKNTLKYIIELIAQKLDFVLLCRAFFWSLDGIAKVADITVLQTLYLIMRASQVLRDCSLFFWVIFVIFQCFGRHFEFKLICIVILCLWVWCLSLRWWGWALNHQALSSSVLIKVSCNSSYIFIDFHRFS